MTQTTFLKRPWGFATDPALAAIGDAYMAQLNAEYARTKAIREGRIPAPQVGQTRWDISDRD